MSSVDTLVPDLPESIADATVATQCGKPGDTIVRNEALVEVEANRVVLEVPTSTDGILDAVLEDEGITITSCQILGRLCEGSNTNREASAKSEEKASTPVQRQQASLEEQNNDALSPAIRRLLTEHSLDTSATKDTGVGGRLTRKDVEKHLAKAPAKELVPAAPAPAAQPVLVTCSEKRVPMTRLRKCAVERLLEVKNSTVMLTTFNEVSMRSIVDLRKQCGEVFKKRHGIHLGFTSFYVKAVVEALRRYLKVNAPIDGGDTVYHDYFDVSMAISTSHGLVMPVLRDIDTLGMADIEEKIKELAAKGRDDKLAVEDLTGGNFTITNGGVSGSLVPTPIINPPQSATLGMYVIKDRPMAVNGQVEVLSIVYLALSYDHRLIDGRESVSFPVTIKELLEDPTCLLLDAQQFKFHLHCRPTWIGCWFTV